MSVRTRLAVATGIVSMIGSLVYGCSSSDGGDVVAENKPDGGHPATPAGGEAGTNASEPTDAGIDTATEPPPTPGGCAIIDTPTGVWPLPVPAACKKCVADRCCVQATTCFGGKAADAGIDGSNGKKTGCQLFGECELACNGNVGCEDQCSIVYGEPAADAFAAYDTCISGPAPTGCSDFCN